MIGFFLMILHLMTSLLIFEPDNSNLVIAIPTSAFILGMILVIFWYRTTSIDPSDSIQIKYRCFLNENEQNTRKGFKKKHLDKVNFFCQTCETYVTRHAVHCQKCNRCV